MYKRQVVIAQYLDLISKESYKEIIEKGKVTQSEEFEIALQKKADDYRAMGLDEVTINTVLDAERRMNPGNQIFDAISKVSTGISVASSDDLKTIAEEILEYDELINAKITLSLDKAEEDASIVSDGIKPNFKKICNDLDALMFNILKIKILEIDKFQSG